MHDQRVRAGALDHIGKNGKRRFRILFVDADAAFDCDRYRRGGLHRGDAVADQPWLGHQASAEAAFLDPVRWTADVQVDFIEAPLRGDLRGLRQRVRIGAADL